MTVVNPNDVLLGVTPLPATNVYNFTKNGNDSHSFSDYNTLLASAKITNDGVAAIAEDLIYEAVFDQTIQFVTAVGIPCDWSDSDTDNVGLPTQITVTGSNNQGYVLKSPEEICAAASLPCADYGFILRAEDIPGFPKGVSIQSVKVELPGLPEDYQSTGQFPVFEGNNLSNAYAGVWGRIRAVFLTEPLAQINSVSMRRVKTPPRIPGLRRQPQSEIPAKSPEKIISPIN